MGLVEDVMGLYEHVQDFVRDANRLTSIEELHVLLSATARNLGFDYFALVHYVNIYQTDADVVHIFDFPKAWTDLVDKQGYFTDDPVLIACQKSGAPFRWDEVPKLIKLTERQEEIFRAAEHAGIGDGFTVPVHIPGEYMGCCSFSTRAGREISSSVLPAAHYVGSFAFEAARRLVQRNAAKRQALSNPPFAPPRLTRRQLECVLLAGRGKSDKAVARELGISNQTVHQHLEDAKRKYDVTTRMQLVIRALFDSQVAFVDLVK